MNLEQNLTTFARGCFLAGTMIATPEGNVQIESIKAGDTVISYNESTGAMEESIVGRVDVLDSVSHFIINGHIRVTGEHPFYVKVGNELVIRNVSQIKTGDNLLHFGGKNISVRSLVFKQGNNTVYNLVNVVPNNNYFAQNVLVHNKGSVGGARGFSGRSSIKSTPKTSTKSTTTTKSTTSTAKPSTTTKTQTTTKKPATGKSTAKPGSKIKTANGKEVQSSAKKPSNTEYTNSRGIVGDNGYSPRFSNGYNAPPGSVVYYRDHSALDYLPWIYLFSQNSPSNDEAIIMQPDSKQVAAKPVQEGVDGLAVFNWFMLIVIVIAIIAGIVWGVNKFTKTKSTPAHAF